MPRNPNEPPELNPNPRSGNMVHFDNTNINKGPEFTGTSSQVAESQRTADQVFPKTNTDKSSDSTATVTVNGAFEGSESAMPGTELMEILNRINPKFKDFSFTRLDGSEVSLDYKVTGDTTVTASEKKAEKPAAQTQGSTGQQSNQSGQQSRT